MKILKIWSIFMLVTILMPALSSCSKDSNGGGGGSESNLLSRAIGTWVCTQSSDVTSGGTIYTGLMVGKTITIKNNGTYTSTSSDFGYTGTFSISEDVIIAKSNRGTFKIKATINGNVMTWDGTASNGVAFKYVFKKNTESGVADLQSLAIGTWKCTQSTDTWQNGNSYTGLMVGKEITIKNDGTYTSTSSDFGTSGSYTISGNKIIAKSISGSMFDITVTFSGDNMTWNGVTNNGITFKYVFQKINAVPNEVYPNYDSNYGLGSL